MIDIQRFTQRNSRRLLALGIIFIALFAASALSQQADRTTSIWAAKGILTSTTKVTLSDIYSVKVALGDQSARYFSNRAMLVGSYVTRTIGIGELIPLSAISKTGSVSDTRQVPMGIGKSDIPSDLNPGDTVDLYLVPTKDSTLASELIAINVVVTSIDRKSQELGGSVNLLITVNNGKIFPILDAVSQGRIVVIRHAL